jgi:hypothetical protein
VLKQHFLGEIGGMLMKVKKKKKKQLGMGRKIVCTRLMARASS